MNQRPCRTSIYKTFLSFELWTNAHQIGKSITLHDSKHRDLRFFNGVKWCNPELVILEFETFKETRAVNPALHGIDVKIRHLGTYHPE
ncbi:hypothetical protein ACLOJK_035851 [Asimina triloba]